MTNSDDTGPTGITVDPPTEETGDNIPVDKPEDPPTKFHIRIDRKEYEVLGEVLKQGRLTGREIRLIAEPPVKADRDLFEIVPGGSDRKIEDSEAVLIRDGMRFFSAPSTINPGTEVAEGLDNVAA